MLNTKRLINYFQQHRFASMTVGHVVIMIVLASTWVGIAFGPRIFGVHAAPDCASNDQAYVVVSGDTLGKIGAMYRMSWQTLATYNKLTNPNMIYVNQTICIPNNANVNGGTVLASEPVAAPQQGYGNLFPYGQCTWWANQRYFQIHGIYVPWTINSDAWQWSARAQDFHWHVSTTPTVGSIMNIQGWVQGSLGLGHVAIVESILDDGRFLTSNMNWAAQYTGQVTYVYFTAGPGVTFITAS